MSMTHAIEMAVKARPGMSLREIGAAVGATDARALSRVSALLHQSCERRKLRADGPPRRREYHPTAITGVDQRHAKRRPDSRAERRKAKRAEVAARKAAQKPARPAEPQPAPPPFRINRLPAPPTKFGANAAPETVAQFQARGGLIDRLPPHASSHPLRFDHSDTTVPTGRRRPVVRARKATAHA